MIRLSSCKFYLDGVNIDFFWSELNKVTVGQKMNPEFGYTTPSFGKFENVFGGRKVGNEFSVFLYRPTTHMFRTEILAKGVVYAQGSGLRIECNFEYPFWSLMIALLLGAAILIPLFAVSIVYVLVVSLIGAALYCLVVAGNHSDIKNEMNEQLKLIEEKAQKEKLKTSYL